MRSLITGITGFAGSHLTEHLLACGDQVLGCSLNTHWPAEVPADVQRRVELIPLDLSQTWPAEISQQVADFRPEVVYHLAALSVPADCGEEEPTEQAIAVNVRGTATLVEQLAALAAPPLLLLASSSYVYEPVPPRQPQVSESSPTNPQSAYGKTKLAAEQVVLSSNGTGGVPAIVARSFQHAGPRQEARMMLAEWASQLAVSSSAPLRVHRCDAWIDFSDVRDVVRAYRLLALRGSPGMTYNIGSGINRRSGDLVEELLRLAGSDRPVEELYPGHRQRAVAVINRLQQATDWAPEISLEQTLSDTLEYWQRRQAADG